MRPFVLLGLVTLIVAACEDTASPTESGGSRGRIAANRVDGTHGLDFTTIDAPGSEFTVGLGVNSSGAIVGFFVDNNGQHGFLLFNGTFTQIDFDSDPNRNTTARGINDAGDIVGNYSGVDGRRHAYLLRGGTYTSFDPPGAVGTAALGISLSSGDIVGFFADNNGQHGFLMNASNLTSSTALNFPGAVNTRATGINDAGDIVGVYFGTSGVNHSFLLSGGRFTSLDVPGAIDTEAWGINDVGQIVGYDLRGDIQSFTEPGFPAPVAEVHGFLLSGGPFIPVNVSGGIDTQVFGINSTGAIVGSYGTPDRVEHAFVGTPRIVP